MLYFGLSLLNFTPVPWSNYASNVAIIALKWGHMRGIATDMISNSLLNIVEQNKKNPPKLLFNDHVIYMSWDWNASRITGLYNSPLTHGSCSQRASNIEFDAFNPSGPPAGGVYSYHSFDGVDRFSVSWFCITDISLIIRQITNENVRKWCGRRK